MNGGVPAIFKKMGCRWDRLRPRTATSILTVDCFDDGTRAFVSPRRLVSGAAKPLPRTEDPGTPRTILS
jgi:hypothetical protein